MPYAAPTPAQFRARFPGKFDTVLDGYVQVALDEGALRVDATWIDDAQRSLGVMLYAAHVLTLEGHGTGAEAEMAKSGALGFRTMQSGSLTLTRDGAGPMTSALLFATAYGRRFLELASLNAPAVLAP